MANFTTISLDLNTNTQGTPTWTALGAANTEARWSDQTGQTSVASASWPQIIRPGATTNSYYTYAYTADAVGLGVLSTALFSNANYNFSRWNWDAVGTFASAPIFTAYDNISHNSPTSRNPSAGTINLLAGQLTDTGGGVSGNTRSYVKANQYGAPTSADQAPGAAPTNAPAATDNSSAGSIATSASAWITNYVGLMADLDYITMGSTPNATTALHWYGEICVFLGPNVTPSVYTPQLTLKYTWT